ncbi:MAG: RusA family crossover junction endodeoxyribonuclease [Desulfurellales bacterium]|nr:MAG: RusA family crossover junction endodeoxyribonuclease [Desulfurellales bacterium]
MTGHRAGPARVESVYLRVSGEPVAKERPRTYTDDAGRSRTITPRKTRAAEEAIGWEFRRQYPGFAPLKCGVQVRLVFHTMSKTKDVDNLAKTALDAMNDLVWADDCQVERLDATVVRGKGAPETIIEVTWREGA